MPSAYSEDGIRLSYRTVGDGPRTVIALHGWLVSGAVYQDLLESLRTDGIRLIVPDLRGSGDSDKPEGGYTLERYALDVFRIAAQEELGSFVLVGHSMGGQIAQWMAASQPDRVDGLVLLCPIPAGGIALPEFAHRYYRDCAANPELQSTLLQLASKTLTLAARNRMLGDAARTSAGCIREAFGAWTRGGLADRLGEIRAPTLVVGTEDTLVTIEVLLRDVVSRIAGARLATIPRAGHYVQIERPAETAAVLEAFLAGLRGWEGRRATP